jgi:hypothetical protein
VPTDHDLEDIVDDRRQEAEDGENDATFQKFYGP